MNKLPTSIVPYGGGDGDLIKAEKLCAGFLFDEWERWDTTALEIKWLSETKTFNVVFRGTGKSRIPMGSVLTQEIPLEIARASRCDCGSFLELGDYSVAIEDSDFRFHADYFCPRCKRHAIAEASGFRRVFRHFLTTVKKLEIKINGVGIERETKDT